MSFSKFRNIRPVRQYAVSSTIVLVTAAICFSLSSMIGYKVAAFVLLLMVSMIAMMFDILPVLLASVLSALVWDFFFIPPRYTFRVSSAEDAFLLLMYFIIASINAVLTNRIRKAEKSAREKEEKANAIKLYNTLLNSLSHELKTPIATIVGATDNLLMEPEKISEADKRKLLTEISLASLRLNQQVENLLSMSRLESGFLQVRRDWCDMNELVYSVINRVDLAFENRTSRIIFEENLPLFKLDAGLVEQVIYNLVNNATLYTPDFTEISISVKCSSDKTFQWDEHSTSRKVAQEVYFAEIIIEDQGPGFPEADLPKVFDKFFRINHNRPGGTGLGLSIVKGFTEAHGGIVTLENIPHGARFTVKIPAEVSYINNLKNE